ncbi:MAG: hypothetical protein PF481_07590 [Bacteroidales bacterium]|nr:hypothetical protein [Bacteroidales bacterium]
MFNPRSFNELAFLQQSVDIQEIIDSNNAELERILIDYATEKVLEEFCRINQYFSFSKQSISNLRLLYSNLFAMLKNSQEPIEEIAKKHYQNLKTWLQKYNSIAYQLYKDADKMLTPVVCAEYSADMQLELL